MVSDLSNSIKIFGKEHIGGRQVGIAGTESFFYRKAMRALEIGEIQDYKNMLNHKSNAVKLLGAWCLAKKDKAKYKSELEMLYSNKTNIIVFSGGCSGLTMTVGKVAQLFSNYPEFIE
jgi:hypothetical protein